MFEVRVKWWKWKGLNHLEGGKVLFFITTRRSENFCYFIIFMEIRWRQLLLVLRLVFGHNRLLLERFECLDLRERTIILVCQCIVVLCRLVLKNQPTPNVSRRSCWVLDAVDLRLRGGRCIRGLPLRRLDLKSGPSNNRECSG